MKGEILKKKIYLSCCTAIMIIFFLAGNKQLSSAYNYGQKTGSNFISQHDGVSEEIYTKIVSLTTKSYQISGGIMSTIGGIGIIVFSYALGKELSEKKHETNIPN